MLWFNIEILLAISCIFSYKWKFWWYWGKCSNFIIYMYYKWNAVETWKHPCNDWGYGLCYVVPVNLYCGSIQSSSRRGGTTLKVLQRRDYDRWYKHTHAPLVAGISIYSPPLLRLLTLKTYFSHVFFLVFL